MPETQGVLLSQTGKLTRQELVLVPTPVGTATHKPVPHAEVIAALIDTLSLRHIAPIRRRICRVKGWHENVRHHGTRNDVPRLPLRPRHP
jgi:hypothetical protein